MFCPFRALIQYDLIASHLKMTEETHNNMGNTGGDDDGKVEEPTMPKPMNVHAMILNRNKKPLGLAKQESAAPTPSNVSLLF